MKIMRFEIDQSGKVEQTERDTAVALTNDKNHAVFLKKTEKRILQKFFKNTQNPGFFPYLTFAALLAILIKEAKPKNKVIIDREYFGHEDLILEKTENYLSALGFSKSFSLEFGHVGKLSTAHQFAYLVARKKEGFKSVSAKKIMEIILGISRTLSGKIKKSVNNRLTQECLPGDRRLHRLRSLKHKK